jgi:NAD(P)-dependent dehydrogenase (short-subunit alcohol dehydrogenase family)
VGLETCRQLATKGLKVVLTARNEARGLEAVEAIRRSSAAAEVFFHQLDVTDPSSAARLADFVRDQYGRLDILVSPLPFASLASLGDVCSVNLGKVAEICIPFCSLYLN